MSDLDWYNVNANRNFPFVVEPVLDTALPWPRDAVLDMGLILGGESEFDAVTDAVWLSRVEDDGSDITLVFLATPFGAAEEFVAVFDRTAAITPPGTIVDITATANQGYGFVVIGNVTNIVAAMDGDNSKAVTAKYGGGNVEVEPSRISTQYGSIVTSVDIIHQEPTKWDASYSSTADSSSASFEDWELVDAAIVDMLYFEDGYNSDVVLDEAQNSITIRAAIGAGLGQYCNWVDQGEPMCGDLIMSFNGILAANNGAFTLQGGPGVEVAPNGPNTLSVGIGDVMDLYCSTPG